MRLTPEEHQQQVELLTFILPKQSPNQKFQPIQLQIKTISTAKQAYSFPSGHIDTIIGMCKRVTGQGCQFEFVDRTSKVPQKIPDPLFVLRESQSMAMEQFLNHHKIGGFQLNGIINAIPGFGKTITQLAIAHKLQLKTLVVTTTTDIRDMWVQEVRKHFGFTPAIIGGGQVDTSTPIVIGNIQTVQKHAQSLCREFGLLIMDEVHHCPASTFEKVLVHSFAGIKLGLSGTLIRKDGKHVLFPGWFSKNVVIPKEENVMIPIVLRTYSKQKFNLTAQPGGWANQVTDLYSQDVYLKEIVCLQAQAHFSGHIPLITSDRVDFSRTLASVLEEVTGKKWALIISEEKNRATILEQVQEGKYQGVVSTTSIFSEGLSLSILSCLILTSSSDNQSLIAQLIGRIQRLMNGKRTPIAIDLALSGGTGYRHQETRAKVYRDKKFPMKYFDSIEQLVDALPDLK